MDGEYPWDGQSLSEVVLLWKLRGMQAAPAPGDEIAQAHYPLVELYPYRDYDWTRQRGRLSGRDWSALKRSLRTHGWLDDAPAFLVIGKDGCVVVGEGNHRLAVAQELGHHLLSVPVHFLYRNRACRRQSSVSRVPQRVV